MIASLLNSSYIKIWIDHAKCYGTCKQQKTRKTTTQGLETVKSFSAGVRVYLFLLLLDLPKLELLHDVYKSCQNIFATVGLPRIRAFVLSSQILVKEFYYCRIYQNQGFFMMGCKNHGKTALFYSIVTIYLGLCPRIKITKAQILGNPTVAEIF